MAISTYTGQAPFYTGRMYSFVSSSKTVWRTIRPVWWLIKRKHREISSFPKVFAGEWEPGSFGARVPALPHEEALVLTGPGSICFSRPFHLLRDLWAPGRKVQLCLHAPLITSTTSALPRVWIPQPQSLPQTRVIPSQGSRIRFLQVACLLHPLWNQDKSSLLTSSPGRQL